MMFSRIVVFVVGAIIAHNLYASDTVGPVWQVSNGKQTLFVGGTIHVLSPSDYPLPKVFDQAYQQADVLVFEADVSTMQTPEIQQLIIDKTQYKNGVTLKSTLAQKTYQRLQQFLQTRGSSVQAIEQFKPGMVTMILTLNEIQRLGQLGQGVDDFYHQLALRDRKSTLFLESIEQQITFLATMGAGQEDDLLEYTLTELDNLDVQLAELKAAWRKGDNTRLLHLGLTPWQEDFPSLYQSLLVQRNVAWLPQLEAMLLTPEVEYVLVGALHLPGDDGVLSMLRERGYQVKQLH
jgi:uncharacterized protein YbaP (TraB family)